MLGKLKQVLLNVVLATLVFSCGATQAQNAREEWRMLGPAFAHHFGTDGALITRKPSSSSECTYAPSNQPPPQPIISPVLIPGLVSAGRTSDGSYIHFPSTTSSMVEDCKTVVVPQERGGWHNSNPALGLEYTRRFESHSDKFMATFVRDSFGNPSFMVTAGRLWPVLSGFGVQVDIGAVGTLWNRTIRNASEDGVFRRTVLFVLPAVSISEASTGLGMNLAIAPKVSVGKYANHTTTLMVQTTWMLRKASSLSSGINVDVKADGVVEVGYKGAF